MRDNCPQHKRELEGCTPSCLFDAFAGYTVFAWWPVRLRSGAGAYAAGWAWWRPVIYRRSIGFPHWYYTVVK